MYVQIYYFSNKLLGGILSQDKKDERVFLKLLQGLKILWNHSGAGDEKTWESPNILVPHPDVCSL